VQVLVGFRAAAAATLERSGAGGLIAGGEGGAGDPLMRLDYVSNLVDVQPGERVFTSGQDGIYPPGFPIGTVLDTRPGAAFRRITVRPAVDVTRLDVVLVVLAKPGEDAGAP
jgi:rod shape-determining protein MreC